MDTLIQLNELSKRLRLECTSRSLIDPIDSEAFIQFLQGCASNGLCSLGAMVTRKLPATQALSVLVQSEMEWQSGHRLRGWKVLEEFLYKQPFIEQSQLTQIYKQIDRMNSETKGQGKVGAELSQYNYYNSETVQRLTNKTPCVNKEILVTMTTCKRLGLFVSTIQSFLNCCEDVDGVDGWLCVDDQSSEDDRKEMAKKFPFFHFVWKSPEQKGHVTSMNIIREFAIKNQYKYIFHIEDDWLFFIKGKYMQDCKYLLDRSPQFGQCLLNKNYAEVVSEWNIYGGKVMLANNGKVYTIHEHYPPDKESKQKEEFYQASNAAQANTCAYWPHFSFRASLTRVAMLEDVGPFQNVYHFEKDYGERYVQKKYLSVFLSGIYCLHTGKLTSERDVLNAYSLNNLTQFDKMTEGSSTSTIKRKWYLNLDRRPDRRGWFEKVNKKILDVFPVERRSAVDGKTITSNYYIRSAFDRNNHHWRKSMIGCALSHIGLWYETLKYPKAMDASLILEDDVILCDRFPERLTQTLGKMNTAYDILILGHHMKRVDSRYIDESQETQVTRVNTLDSAEMSLGGTFGYVITKQGAHKMLQFLQLHTIDQGIDTMMIKACNTLKVFYVTPHLVYSLAWSQDSNIQSGNFQQEDFLVPSSPEEYARELAGYAKKILPDGPMASHAPITERTEQQPTAGITVWYSDEEIITISEEPNIQRYNQGKVVMEIDESLVTVFQRKMPDTFEGFFV